MSWRRWSKLLSVVRMASSASRGSPAARHRAGRTWWIRRARRRSRLRPGRRTSRSARSRLGRHPGRAPAVPRHGPCFPNGVTGPRTGWLCGAGRICRRVRTQTRGRPVRRPRSASLYSDTVRRSPRRGTARPASASGTEKRTGGNSGTALHALRQPHRVVRRRPVPAGGTPPRPATHEKVLPAAGCPDPNLSTGAGRPTAAAVQPMRGESPSDTRKLCKSRSRSIHI